ncbi:MAG: ribosome small subunit-dependent GTPase A [Prochlorococcaceae cyanobacterium]
MGAEAPGQALGLVVALQANFCRVQLDQAAPGQAGTLLCTRRTRLGKSGQQICVGDRVRLEGIDWAAGRGAVAAIEPRQAPPLQRPAVANVDRVVVVIALAEPSPDPLQLTRFLVTAEASGRPVQLVLTKVDRTSPEQAELWRRRLSLWGYDPALVSVVSGSGLEPLRQRLALPGIAVLCGPSGVGKSSLLNALLPQLQLRVGAVSGRLQRGRHTTRHVELFALAPGALLADSPGFNRPQLPADPVELAACFPELRACLAEASCRFSNCLHRGDPGCVVAAGWDRFPLYLNCLEECLEQKERLSSGAELDQEPGLRQRGDRLEPRLKASLRQPSRRSQRQQLANDNDGGSGAISRPGQED